MFMISLQTASCVVGSIDIQEHPKDSQQGEGRGKYR